MNFYLADSNGYYDPAGDNAYVPDFFVGILYETRKELGFSLDVLFSIDPYETVMVENLSGLKDEIEHLINIPNHIVFNKYPYVSEHIEKLKKYLRIALEEGRIIISEGD